jgi:hypothetical protein
LIEIVVELTSELGEAKTSHPFSEQALVLAAEEAESITVYFLSLCGKSESKHGSIL